MTKRQDQQQRTGQEIVSEIRVLLAELRDNTEKIQSIYKDKMALAKDS